MNKQYVMSTVVACFAITAQSSFSHAQVTPEQIALMKNVSSSTIADNGNLIAYTISNPVDPKKDNAYSQAHLYIYDKKADKSAAYFTSASVSQVAFRPNTGTITFLSRGANDKTNSLYEININGGEARKLFTYSSNISSYNWHPNGQELVFISSERGSQPKTTLTYSPRFFEEEYNDNNAYITHVSSKMAPKKLNINGSAYMAKWSNDGKKIAISVAPTSSVDDSYMAQKIKVVDVNSSSVIAHIDNEGKLGQISWSPDNNYIAIIGAYDLNDPTDGSLLVVSANGGKPTVIDGGFQGKMEQIIWKEQSRIHYLASEGTSNSIGTIKPNGNDRQVIYKATAANITSFSMASNGTIAFTANTPLHPSELFVLDGNKKGAKAERKTNSNEWLNGLKLGKQEVISYKARDGKYTIEGLLIYPINYVQGTKVPLITVVHGGPESHYSNGWLTAYSMPGQMAAAKGYAVFYPNYRGSTGRGTDFGYSSQGDLAGKEFDDIVDGVDYLIEQGIADKKRVGVTGGSYGGYASAWMSTYYSDRFAAAVMFVGISNNISKFGTSDIPTEMRLVHERGDVWDNWEKQLKISPIYYADRAKTPILIMHGAEDPRVHPAQSMELYRHLKVRKPELPVRLIYYPGEGHGNQRSGSKYDYNLRMMQWFDTYLKTGNPNAPKPSLDLPE
jgi:dipeptidyl aminopeptidase/acylaminoacyl peptidase